MKTIIISNDNFEEIKKSEKPVLIDFYANWCGPCKMLSPIIDEIAKERDDVIVGKVDVDSEPELSEKFGVFSIPTLVILKNGEIAHQSAGARPKAQILQLIENQ